MACTVDKCRQGRMDIRGNPSWKTFSESLLSRPYGHTVWGNDLADGSQKPLSASMASTLSFVLPSDGISNIPCLVSCPRACNTRWFGLPSQKNEQNRPKNIGKIVLDCYYAGFCLFTATLRISGVWRSGFTTISSLVNAAGCFFMEWLGFTFAEFCPHHCTGWSEAPP